MADNAGAAPSAGAPLRDPKSLKGIAKDTYQEWKADEADDMAAALAYWSVLSIAPLLVLALAIVGAVYGEAAARNQLSGQLNQVMSPQAAEGVQQLLANVKTSGTGTWATILSIGALLFSATSLVGHLKRSLNHIWNVEPHPEASAVKLFLRDRVLGLLMILGVGLLLLASIILSALISGMTDFIRQYIGIPPLGVRFIQLGLTFMIITALFGLIYKVLPDVKIAWKNVAIGAAVTSVLFVLGNWLLGIYLGRGSVASSYGVAGSFAVLLIWIYYSSLIFFMGAEFTQVYSRYRGVPVTPSKDAVPADSPEALAARPHVEKTITCPTARKGSESSATVRAAVAHSRPGKAGKPRERRSAQIQVPLPPEKTRGSLVGGLVSFLAVRAASKAAKPKSRG